MKFRADVYEKIFHPEEDPKVTGAKLLKPEKVEEPEEVAEVPEEPEEPEDPEEPEEVDTEGPEVGRTSENDA